MEEQNQAVQEQTFGQKSVGVVVTQGLNNIFWH